MIMSNENESGKPTAGPWFRDKYGHVVDGEGKDINFRGVSTLCSGDPARLAEAEANTTLAASSHALLSALEDLMRIVDNSGDEQYVTIQLTPEFFEPARAAISRARGLSQ
jgi:hypothetical protein